MNLREAGSHPLMPYVLFAATVGSLLLLCFLPRSVAPTEPPPLVLDAAQVAEVVRADTAAAAKAPATEHGRELDQRFLEFGEAEVSLPSRSPAAMSQKQSLARLYQSVVAESGEAAGLALRARALARFEDALALKLPKAEAKRVLGRFAEAIERHGVTRAGDPVAPHFVLRTLYKARWNLAIGRRADTQFAPVEKRAYHGWLALHASNLSPQIRSLELQQYARAGGRHAAESQGALAFLGQDYTRAVTSLKDAYAREPTLRLRNWLRGAERMAADRSEIAPAAPGR